MAEPQPSISVLVVDDERDVRLLIGACLERAGFRVSMATNGAAALRQVEADPPAVVVTDLMMPVMGGRELIDRLRADPACSSIGILVISASLRGEPTGADACIEKPFHPDDVAAAVARLAGTTDGES